MMFSRGYFTPVIRRSMLIGILAAGLLMLAGGPARADNSAPNNPTPSYTPPDPNAPPTIPGGVTLQAVGTETGSWESNPLLLVSGAKPLYGSVTTPELIFDDKTPTSLLSIDTLMNENVFNLTNFDSTDFHQKVGVSEQLQNWGFNVQQATDYDTTRTSNLFPGGLNGVLVNQAVRHLGLSIAPQISYSPEATDKIALSGSLQDSQYYNDVFSNYALFSAGPTYTHAFDPLNAGTFSIMAQRYETTSGATDRDDSITPTIGWIGTLTPRLSTNVSVGVQTTRQYAEGSPSEPWTLAYVFSGTLAFKGQQDTTNVQINRTNYPFGNGTEALLSTYSLSEVHALNSNVSLNFGASYQSASYQSTANGDLNYLATGTGGLTYHATDRLDVTAAYQYRYETLVGTSGNAQDNMATLSLVYRPKAWSL